jgi:hypothetical protein
VKKAIDELLFYCELCGFQEVEVSFIDRDADGPCDWWSDIVCKKCRLILNTVKIDNENNISREAREE